MMTVRRSLRHLVVGLGLAAVLHIQPSNAGGGGPVPDTRDLLGAIDFVPARQDLDTVMGPTSLQQLIILAIDDDEDAGVRLRAVRALGQFPEADEARATLESLINALAASSTGTPVLILRAAMEALAEIGGAAAVAKITPLLDNPSRDVRASAADALRIIGSPTAIPALRDRQEVETVPQVLLAITEALRALLGG
jgi:HEAT repeat protein